MHPRRIKLPGELIDFGLSKYGRGLRDRLSHFGYRLARHRWYWRIYKSYLGGDDVLLKEFGNLSQLRGWVDDLEREKSSQPQSASRF
jgi:hypothetical protein